MNRSPLVPCPSCDRHVRSDTAACPFCDAALPASPVAVPAVSPGLRLGRAATFAFGATLGLAACDSGSTHALYGTVPSDVMQVDAASDGASGSDVQDNDATPTDAATDGSDGGLVAAYGGPPSDGG